MATKLLGGKVAVIMGAANRIGKAVAEKFVANGARVILADLDHNACHTIASGINATTPSAAHAMLAPCDATDPSKILDAVREANRIHTRDVDIFYHNAAFYSTDSIGIASLRRAMEANVESVLASIELAGGVMGSNKSGGCFLCTGSTLGLLGDVVPSAYSISMAALVDVIRAKAAELAVHGVRVHAISPHLAPPSFDTDMLKKTYPHVKPKQLDDMIHKYVTSRPVVTEVDVANVAVYLASGDRKDMIGRNIELKDKFPLIGAVWHDSNPTISCCNSKLQVELALGGVRIV